jgi:hypothetical protein
MKRLWPILAFVLVLVATSLQAKECGQKIRGQLPERIIKELLERPAAPAFYFRLENFVVVVAPERLLHQLKEPTRTVHPPHDARLLALVEADLPLRDDADLFKYILKDADLYNRLYAILSDLLIGGNASVVDVLAEPSGRALREMRIYRYHKLGDYYEFCTPTNLPFLAYTTIVE